MTRLSKRPYVQSLKPSPDFIVACHVTHDGALAELAGGTKSLKGRYLPGLTITNCDLDGYDFTDAFIPNISIVACRWYGKPPCFRGATMWNAEIEHNQVQPYGHGHGAITMQRHALMRPTAHECGDFRNADLTGATIELRGEKAGLVTLPSKWFRGAFLAGLKTKCAITGDEDPHLAAVADKMPAEQMQRFYRLRQMLLYLSEHAANFKDAAKMREAGLEGLVDTIDDETAYYLERGELPRWYTKQLPDKSPGIIMAALLHKVAEYVHFNREKIATLYPSILTADLRSRADSSLTLGLTMFSGKIRDYPHLMVIDAIIADFRDIVFSRATTVDGQVCIGGMSQANTNRVVLALDEAQDALCLVKDLIRPRHLKKYDERMGYPVRGQVRTRESFESVWTAKAQEKEPAVGEGTVEHIPFSVTKPTKIVVLTYERGRFKCPKSTRQGAGTPNHKYRERLEEVHKAFARLNTDMLGNRSRVEIVGLQMANVSGPINASGTTFEDCILVGCDLNLWDLRGARFIACTFDQCIMGTVSLKTHSKWFSLWPDAAMHLPHARLDLRHSGGRKWVDNKGNQRSQLPDYSVLNDDDTRTVLRPTFVNCDMRGITVKTICEQDLRALWRIEGSGTMMPYMYSEEYKAGRGKPGPKPTPKLVIPTTPAVTVPPASRAYKPT